MSGFKGTGGENVDRASTGNASVKLHCTDSGEKGGNIWDERRVMQKMFICFINQYSDAYENGPKEKTIDVREVKKIFSG